MKWKRKYDGYLALGGIGLYGVGVLALALGQVNAFGVAFLVGTGMWTWGFRD